MSKVMLDDLAAWMATTASLVVGTSLFTGAFDPDSPAAGSVAFCLREAGGPARAGYSVVDQYAVQVTCRGGQDGNDYDTVRSACEDLWISLFPSPDKRGRLNVRLSNDWLAHSIKPVQTPADMGVSPETQRRSYVFNLIVKAVRITA